MTLYLSLLILVFYRSMQGDDNEIIIGIFISFSSWSMMEPQIYTNMKSKAHLFLQIKIVE